MPGRAKQFSPRQQLSYWRPKRYLAELNMTRSKGLWKVLEGFYADIWLPRKS